MFQCGSAQFRAKQGGEVGTSAKQTAEEGITGAECPDAVVIGARLARAPLAQHGRVNGVERVGQRVVPNQTAIAFDSLSRKMELHPV
jgi:hypothetical protein